MAEWVATRPIFDVCVQETGYERGGVLWVPWWIRNAAEDQLRVTVEAFLETSRVWRQQEAGRRDGSERGS